MKKLLLTLAVLLGFAGLAKADEVTFDFKTNNYGMPNDGDTYVTTPYKIESGNVTITLDGPAQSYRMWSDGLRMYKNKDLTLVISVSEGTIEAIDFASANAAVCSGLSTTNGTYAASGKTGKWTGSSSTVSFAFKTTVGNYAMQTITVTTSAGGTVDPDPDPEPDPEPVEIVAKSVKEVIALDNNTEFTADFAFTVGWVSGKNVFTCDAAGDFIQIYNENTLAVGDVIPAGLKGTYTLYNGATPEIINATIPEATPGTFTPKAVAAADITTALVNSVILVKGVDLADGAPDTKTNFTGTVGATTLTFRNNYTIEGVQPGTYDITVVVNVYNGNVQLYTLAYVESSAVTPDEPAEEQTLTLKVEDATDIAGTYVETTYKADGSVQAYAHWQPLESLKIGDYTFAFASTGNTKTAYYEAAATPYTIRFYNGSSMTITAPEGTVMTNILMTGNNGKDDCLGSVTPGSAEYANQKLTWNDPNGASAVTFNFANSYRITSLDITYISSTGGGDKPDPTPDPTPAEGDVIYEDACLTADCGFVSDAAEGDFNPWSIDAKYGLKATAFVSGAANTSDAVMVSPVFDLVNAKAPLTLTFDDAVNQFKLNGTMIAVDELGEYVSVVAREVGGEWEALGTPKHDAFSWTYAAQQFDLSSYVGKKMEFGFRYVSTDECAGTWEIKNVKLYAGEGSVTNSDVDNIAAFIDNCTTSNQLTYSINNPVVALYQNGSNLYVKDDSGYLLVYGNVKQTYANGMTIPAGITGKAQDYNGVYELSSPVAASFKAGEAGEAVEPEAIETTPEAIEAAAVNTFVMMRGASFSQDLDGNWVLVNSKREIPFYNKFGLTLVDGGAANVSGFIGIQNGKKVLLPTAINIRADVPTPTFSVKAGAVAEGSVVAIECADPEAVIYYNLDGGYEYISVYTEPIEISEPTTIKAIAINGAQLSLTARASYTVKAGGTEPGVNEGDGTFNFADPTTLSPAYGDEGLEADGSTGNFMHKVNDVTFTSGAASVVNSHAEGTGTDARLYKQASGDWSYRFYKNSTTTVSVPAGYSIDKIEFTTQTSTHANNLAACTFSTGTYADKVWTPSEEGTTEVVITVTGTVGLTYMTVVYTGSEGISDIEAADAPVEYYNLQGIRVANPENGIFIRRQGNKVSKVAL